jgi:hypothetical protein
MKIIELKSVVRVYHKPTNNLDYSRVRGPNMKEQMVDTDGSFLRRKFWLNSGCFPRVTRRRLLSRYERAGLFTTAQYRVNMAFEEAVAELRSVLDQ